MTVYEEFMGLFMSTPTTAEATIVYYVGSIIIALVVILGVLRFFNHLATLIWK